jgi:hypothetical protein
VDNYFLMEINSSVKGKVLNVKVTGGFYYQLMRERRPLRGTTCRPVIGCYEGGILNPQGQQVRNAGA